MCCPTGICQNLDFKPKSLQAKKQQAKLHATRLPLQFQTFAQQNASQLTAPNYVCHIVCYFLTTDPCNTLNCLAGYLSAGDIWCHQLEMLLGKGRVARAIEVSWPQVCNREMEINITYATQLGELKA